MELLKEAVNTISFYLPDTVTEITSATYSVIGGTQNQILPTNDPVNGVVTATLPFFENEAKVDVRWNFMVGVHGAFKQIDNYEIVTPILQIREVKAILGTTNDQEAVDAERAVRYVIQAHTGQNFGKIVETKTVVGDGSTSLSLPARLLSLTDINGNPQPSNYAITGDGWYIKAKAGFVYGSPSITTVTGPIYYPWGKRSYPDDYPYQIAGTWGYNNVPEPVREAAKLLINDYGCGDSIYRDRYIESMTAADWRIQFNSGAYYDTGNARANQLLNQYVLQRGWAVL